MRVISMVPSWTETLIEAGVNVVGRTRFCIHPRSKVREIAIVGGTKDIDWQKVNALEADVLILDQEENPKFFAEQSPMRVVVTHVKNVPTVARDLERLAQELNNSQLVELAKRWINISKRQVPPAQNLTSLPGISEWTKPPPQSAQHFIYIIWHNPWMAVARDTFIGSVFESLGYGNRMQDFSSSYPKIVLEEFDPAQVVLLCSSEPFPFAKRKNLLIDLPFSCALMDGELFSWFGLRSLVFLESLTSST